jgi:glycosyltransferase involved in cell wall biosynthesis
LAMGLPCVATIATFSATVVPRGEGVLADDRPQEFAAGVVRLLRDHEFRKDMARRARLSAETYYTWEAQMKRLDEVIASVTRSREIVAG